MVERAAEITVEDGGDPPTVRTGLSATDVVGIIRSLEGRTDVTATIQRKGIDERLLVAISGGKAFLGLDAPEGVFQFALPGEHHSGTQRLVIGGQATDIESRYVLCVDKAARVAYEWLKGSRHSVFGAWQRQ